MVLTQAKEQYLKTLYYDIRKPGSLRGPLALYNLVQNEGNRFQISKNDILKWLEGESVYTRWKPARLNYPRNHIDSHYVGHIFQFDLMSFTTEKEILKGKAYKYAFIGLDTFSRFAFIVPLTDNTSESIIEALEAIFDTVNYTPTTALADPAGEHVSTKTKKFFKSRGIHLYFTNSKLHAPHCERLIRTLRMGLRRYRTAFNTLKWMKPLEHLVNQYNNTVTRAHGLKPSDVFFKPKLAWQAYEQFFLKEKKKAKKLKLPKRIVPKKLPKVGDYVRISRIKHPFEKESTELGQFSREVFKIVEIDKFREIPTFKLVDLKNKPVKGKFLPYEIQKIKYDPKNLFEVEKILGRKTKRGVEYVRVKWKGYNKRFASWIPESDIMQVQPSEMISHID